MATVHDILMTNKMQIRLTIFMLLLAFLTLVGIFFDVAAQCKNCQTRQNPETQREKEYFDKVIGSFYDKALDNPKDSTTSRWLNCGPLLNFGLKNLTEERIKEVEKIMVDFILHDNYSVVRNRVLNFYTAGDLRNHPIFSSKLRDVTVKKALNDQCLLVRLNAAIFLVDEYYREYTDGKSTTSFLNPQPKAKYKNTVYSPNQESSRIISDAAAGVGFSNWNVKGFYSDEQLAKNSGVADSIRGEWQLFAISRLVFQKKSPEHFLDSIAQRGEIEAVRNSAKRGRELLDRSRRLK
jgi:hypothetical protein